MKKIKKNKINGKVYLVGAGPGALELLTLKAARLITEADVLIYDSLVNPAILNLNTKAEKVYAGKNVSDKSKSTYISQEKINPLLVRYAKKYKKVIRLKGGDPFVFGRGGEEASYLKSKGIFFEVVPGVSSGMAGPAYAGIPVTDRRKASVVTFVAAHGKSLRAHAGVHWKGIAKIKGTIVLFMGLTYLEKTMQTLARYGKKKTMPVSVIESATMPHQRTIQGTIANISSKIKDAKIKSPALIVVGEVNRFRKELNWYSENKKLSGKTILVTRAGTQAGTLSRKLESNGAKVIEYPVIEIAKPKNFKSLDVELKKINKYDWVLFTSVNAVEAVMSRIEFLRKDARAFSGVKIGAIGEATQTLLKSFGLQADFVPSKYTSKALIAGLHKKRQIKGKSFFLPRTDIAPPYLVQEIEYFGGRTKQVIAYRTLPAKDVVKRKQVMELLNKGSIDCVTFTSASTVKNFFKWVSPSERRRLETRIASIGPVTSKTLKERGISPHFEAKTHTIDGLIKSIYNNL